MKYSSRQSHAIDLTTYVRSLPADTTTWWLDLDRLIKSRTVDDLELALPTSWDRVTWEATDDIVVTSVIPHSQTPSMDFSLDGFLSLTIGDVYSVGYRTNGSEILFLPTDRLQYPLLVIRKEATIPVEVGTVRRAIVRDRATVSTTEEEYNLTDRGTFRDGDDRASWDGAKTLSTLRDCATEQSTPQGDSVDNDVDDDGLLDSCEYQIAKAFRPRLMLDKDERYADRQTYWEVRRPDVGEELTQQGADRLRAQELWLFYALGYYYDGGRYGFSWHDGDSEFVVASVAPVGTEADSLWTLKRICFAAHWDTAGEFHECYDADESTVEYYDGKGGRPKVWVAYNKHGSYPSATQCRSHKLFWWIKERCGRTEDGKEVFEEADVEIRESRRLGKYDASSEWNIEEWVKYRTGTERLWSREEFCGWHRSRHPCGGNYLRSLKAWKFAPDTASGIFPTSVSGLSLR